LSSHIAQTRHNSYLIVDNHQRGWPVFLRKNAAQNGGASDRKGLPMKTSSLALCAIILAFGLAPGAFAASATVSGISPRDAVEQQGIANSPAVFTLTSDYQASLVRFDHASGNRVCNHISHGVDTARPVPLDVKWDGGEARLMPDDCVRVDAPSANIAPAGQLAPDEMLQGM
jgi:hypothetical protein